MPAIQIEISLGPVNLIGASDLIHSSIRGGKLHIFVINIKIIGTTEIILCACTANGGKFLIPIYVELNFPFAPPAVTLYTPMHIGSHIMAAAFYVIEYHIRLFIWQWVYPPELGVEIQRICGKLLFFSIDLVVNIAGIFANILHFHFEAFKVRHFKITV
jgi:hypothetical protein